MYKTSNIERNYIHSLAQSSYDFFLHQTYTNKCVRRTSRRRKREKQKVVFGLRVIYQSGVWVGLKEKKEKMTVIWNGDLNQCFSSVFSLKHSVGRNSINGEEGEKKTASSDHLYDFPLCFTLTGTKRVVKHVLNIAKNCLHLNLSHLHPSIPSTMS